MPVRDARARVLGREIRHSVAKLFGLSVFDGFTDQELDGTTTGIPGICMVTKLVLVTPKMAKELLARNHPKNRILRSHRLEKYKSDLHNNAWKVIHQGICVGKNVYTVDGQHRLEAVVETGVAAYLNVTYNPDAEYDDPIDQVYERAIAQVLRMSSRYIAGLNMLRCLEAGFLPYVGMTLDEAGKVFLRYEPEFVKIGEIPYKQRLLGPTIAACVWAMPCGEIEAIEFAARTASGEMIARGHPVFAYRNWLTAAARGVPNWERTMGTLNCLRHFMHGSNLTAVYTTLSGYRAFASRRRALKVPNTPGSELVKPGSWTPTHGDRTEEE